MFKKIVIISILTFVFNEIHSQSITNIRFVRIVFGVSQNITGLENVSYCEINNNIKRDISFDYSGFMNDVKFRLELILQKGTEYTFYRLLEEGSSTIGTGSMTFSDIKFPYDADLGQRYYIRIKSENPNVEQIYPAAYLNIDNVFPTTLGGVQSEKELVCEDSIDEVTLEARNKYPNLIYVWDRNGIEVGSGRGLTSVKVKLSGSYKYSLKKTNTSAECGSGTRTILKLEKVSFNLSSDIGNISGECTDREFNLVMDNIKVSDGASYEEQALDKDIIIEWYKDGVIINGQNRRNYKVSEAGTYTAKATICGGNSYQLDFIVNFIKVDVIGGLVLCDLNKEIKLVFKDLNTNNTYQWYKDGIPISGETLSDIIIRQKGKYSLGISGTCSNFITKEIEIIDFDDVKDGILFSENSYEIDIMKGEKIIIKVENTDSIYVEKDRALFFEGKNQFDIEEKGEYTVYAFIGNCYITMKYKVNNLDELREEIQNVINLGNPWVLPNSLKGKPNIRVIIINVYGMQILDQEGYKNDWTGTDKNGSPLKKGVYFYFIFRNERELINGSITVL